MSRSGPGLSLFPRYVSFTLHKKDGTKKYYTYLMESVISKFSKFTAEEIAKARRYAIATPPEDLDPRIGALVNELIGRVADKWTMMVLEVLTDFGEVRFTRLSEKVEGISQKMLTQTLRHMERDGLVIRTIHPVVPPKVEYRLTGLGLSLGSAFCGVWVWAAENLEQVEQARQAFDCKTS